MRRSFYRNLCLALAACSSLWTFTGCASHKPARVHSYDQAMDEDKDPTYKPDPERADEEVRQQ